MDVGLAKNNPKSEFQSHSDPNPDLMGSNPVSTSNHDLNLGLTPNSDPNSIPNPNPVLYQLFPDPSLNMDPVFNLELSKLLDFTTHKGI